MLRVLMLLLLLLSFAEATAQSQNARSGLTAFIQVGEAPASAPAPPSTTDVAIYTWAEQMPAFPGGEAAFQRFIREKAQFPESALANSIEGKVYVRFVVDEAGRIRDAEVVKGLGYGLNEEALRLVRIMPWWIPGRLQGKPVRVSLTMPITFRAVE